MGLFATSQTAAVGHGLFGIERTPPAVIQATGTATVAVVAQFPWGPEELYTPGDMRDFLEKFAPLGMSRTGAAYLSMIKKRWVDLRIARVTGSGAAVATATVSKAGPVAMLTLNLKYKGTEGNNVKADVKAAQDGDANHFDLEVYVSNAQGETRDVFRNLNFSGTGADFVPDLTGGLLLGSVTKIVSGLPVLTTALAFTGGSDGTVAATDFVGTEGLGDKGVALCEGDDSIDFVMTADPGNSFRAVVNAGLSAHATYMGDRFAILNGNSGLTLAQAQTAAALNRSLRTVFVDVWGYITDDVDGTERLVPSAPFFASVASQLSPSTSPAWKDERITTQMLGGLVRLEARRGKNGAAANERLGIVTLQKEAKGGFSFECAVNTAAPLNPAKGTFKRSRMGHYMVRSVRDSLRSYTDAPNVSSIQQDEVIAVTEFLEGLKQNTKTDPINKPHIVAYSIKDLATFNSFSSIQAGQFTIPVDVTISADQSQIFFSINYGETVKVSVDL